MGRHSGNHQLGDFLYITAEFGRGAITLAEACYTVVDDGVLDVVIHVIVSMMTLAPRFKRERVRLLSIDRIDLFGDPLSGVFTMWGNFNKVPECADCGVGRGFFTLKRAGEFNIIGK